MMKKIFLIPILLFACGHENGALQNEEENVSIFKDSVHSEFLEAYMSSYKESRGNSMYTVTFDTDSTAIFSTALYVVQNNLVGHRYYDDDIVLIYDNSGCSGKYINMKSVQKDSIRRFPYRDQIENLPPYDPVEKKYDLKNKKELKGFKGSNRPVLVTE